VNWQLHRNTRVMLDGIVESFEDDVTFSNGDRQDRFVGALIRFQLDF
jgi:phosphate-selective porin